MLKNRQNRESAHRAALARWGGAIVAVGNAPTALLELLRIAREEGARPAVVIGVPAFQS